jgi:hypothetical protein
MPAVHDRHRFTTLHQGQPRWQTLAELLKRGGAHGRENTRHRYWRQETSQGGGWRECAAIKPDHAPMLELASGLNPLVISDLGRISCIMPGIFFFAWHLFFRLNQVPFLPGI